MPSQNTPLSVAQVVELENDAWVNGGFTAVVRSMERKQSKAGKTFWKCKLADTTGSATVGMTMFFAPKFAEGDQVDFLGNGIKFKNGQYGPEVSVGDKAEIHVVGKSVHHEDQSQRAAAGAPALNGAPQLVNGQTVGMAMKEALALTVMAWGGIENLEKLKDPLFWADVKTNASNIIRISRSIERGHLSPAPWGAANGASAAAPAKPTPPPSQPQRAAMPAPGPEGSAYDPSEENNEDVPF